VSTLVNQLVAKDYLHRDPSTADRRAAVLTATEAGRDRLARWADERVRLLVGELDQLEPDELDALRAALPALRHLATSLSGSSSGPGSGSGPGLGPGSHKAEGTEDSMSVTHT
jgi:hypothetical protein